MSTNTDSGAPATLDYTMMFAAHDAFRRDIKRLIAATDPRTGSLRAFKEGWVTFKYYLTIHHSAEDTSLWPPVRRRAGADPERIALLDAMEAEHELLDPLMAKVDRQLAEGSTEGLGTTVRELGAALVAHLEHEEKDGLPLIGAVLPERDWEEFGAEQRRAVGTKGAAAFFPWLLDGASPAMEQQVLSLVPPPVRFLYRKQWRPKYDKRSPWATH